MWRESTRARRKFRAARHARTLKPALCSAWFSTTSICIRVDGFAGFVVPSLRCEPGLMSDLLAASGAGSFGLQHAQPMTATVWRRGGLCGGAERCEAAIFGGVRVPYLVPGKWLALTAFGTFAHS